MDKSKSAEHDPADEFEPPGRWFTHGCSRGFLAKCNPTATPGSVVRQAVIWGIAAPLFQGCVLWFLKAPAIHFQLRIPVFAVLGALVGAVMEWQWDDNEHDGDDDCPDDQPPKL